MAGAPTCLALTVTPNRQVFWPPEAPQLNCPDPRFQFLNLHAFGKARTLCRTPTRTPILWASSEEVFETGGRRTKNKPPFGDAVQIDI